MVERPPLGRGVGPALTPERILRRLEWQVIRRLDGRLQGDFRTVFRGNGVDVVDLREYQPGDDLRRIDWNVTARTDTPHVREYVEDRELTAWLLLDRSASMRFGPIERRKHVVLSEVSATIAQLLSRGGNRVGAVLFDTAVEEVIAPASGRNQVLRILSRLLQEHPDRAGGRTPAAPKPSAFGRWRASIRRQAAGRQSAAGPSNGADATSQRATSL